VRHNIEHNNIILLLNHFNLFWSIYLWNYGNNENMKYNRRHVEGGGGGGGGGAAGGGAGASGGTVIMNYAHN
jgi:hypothetical protein